MAPETHSLSPSLLQGSPEALSCPGGGLWWWPQSAGSPPRLLPPSRHTTAVPGAPVARPLLSAHSVMSSEGAGPCGWMASGHALEAGRPGVRAGRTAAPQAAVKCFVRGHSQCGRRSRGPGAGIPAGVACRGHRAHAGLAGSAAAQPGYGRPPLSAPPWPGSAPRGQGLRASELGATRAAPRGLPASPSTCSLLHVVSDLG